MYRKALVALILVTALAAVPAVTAEEQVVGSPEIDVSVADNRFGPSDRGTLDVVLSNSGDVTNGGPAEYEERVKTARNVRVSIDEGNAPIDVKTGTVTLGAVEDGVPRTASFGIETGESVEPGRYEIPVEIEYDSTRVVEYLETASSPGYTGPRYSDFDRSVTETVEIVVESEPRFDVVSENSSNLYAGDSGMYELTVRNVGDETARDATVRLTSGSRNIAFGPLTNPRGSTSVSASDIAPGETATVSAKINADTETTEGEYPVTARVGFDNSNGVNDISDNLSTDIFVDDERSFRLENLETKSLRVGEDDVVVTADVVNEGPAPAYNAVVTVSDEGSITPTGPESAVGTLSPGESKNVEFRLAVSEDAEPGNRSLAFGVEYENEEGDLRSTETPVRERVTVGEERDDFEVVDVETSVTAGGSNELRVDVRNTGDSKVEDANAKVFLNDPLSSSDNSAFLGEMDVGETRTAVFTVSATGDAVAKEYAGSLEVRYEDGSGDTELSDGISFGIPVAESSGGIPTAYVVAGVLVLVIAGGVFVYTRR
ncbi:MAG: COG1361 S-layer family protein [Halobacteriales archaeon]